MNDNISRIIPHKIRDLMGNGALLDVEFTRLFLDLSISFFASLVTILRKFCLLIVKDNFLMIYIGSKRQTNCFIRTQLVWLRDCIFAKNQSFFRDNSFYSP